MSKKLSNVKTIVQIKEWLINEASKGNDFIVITDKESIWGSNASYEAIRFGGGKIAIVRAAEIEEKEIYGQNDWAIGEFDTIYSIEQLSKLIKEYWYD